jgi:hypothetical protein
VRSLGFRVRHRLDEQPLLAERSVNCSEKSTDQSPKPITFGSILCRTVLRLDSESRLKFQHPSNNRFVERHPVFTHRYTPLRSFSVGDGWQRQPIVRGC